MLQIVHLSDLHIRSELDKDGSYPYLNAAGRKVKELVNFLGNNYPHAHVVVTGDITDSGTTQSIRLARWLLRRFLFSGKLHIVPGNHDFGTKGIINIPSRRKYFHQAFRQALPPIDTYQYPWLKYIGHVALIGLDSTSPTDDAAEGRIGGRQLIALDALLRQVRTEGVVPVVMMHHDPWYDEWLCKLQDKEDFLSVIKKYRIGRGPLILFGHGHQKRLRRHTGKFTKVDTNITYLASPSSVDSRLSRLRFRIITLSDEKITWTWGGCPW